MRVLIVVLLALAVDATSYGWSSYGGSPSYSYGGGYGSSLYGASYGSGSGWGGSGYGYGSGGWGGSRHEQPQSIKTAYQTGYTSDEIPKSIAFTLGDTGYQSGTSDVAGHQEWQTPVAVSRHSHQQPQITRKTYQSGGYSTGAAPGNIAFTLGGAGYETGTSGVSGYQEWKAPAAVSRPAAVYRQRTASIHRSGAQGAVAPAKITFTQDFSGVAGLHRSGGSAGISTHRTVAPAAVITERHSYQQPQITRTAYQSGGYSTGAAPGNIAFTLGGAGYQTGAAGVSGHQEWKAPVAVTRQTYQRPHSTRTTYQSGYSSGAAPGNIAFTLGGAGYQTGTSGVSGHQEWKAPVAVTRQTYQRPHSARTTYQSGYSSGAAPGNIAFTLGGAGYQTGTAGVSGYQEWKAPVAVSRPAAVVSHRTTSVRRTGVHGATAGVAPAKITFTQDFSRVAGQSGGVHRSGGISGVSAFKKAIAPAVVVTERQTYQRPHSARTTYQSVYSSGAAPGNIAFTLGGAGYQTGTAGVSGYQEWKAPVAVSRVPSGSYGSSGGVRQSGFLGTTVARPQIRYTQGVSGHSQHQVSGHRVTGAQGFSAAGPAKITFTQDFSKVTGHQTARVKPVVSTHNKLSVSEFPGVVSTGAYQGHRTNVISAPKPVVKVQYKAPKRPVVTQEPSLTTIYEHAPAREAVVDKTVYVSPTGPATTAGFAGDYKQEITTVVGGQGVDKQSTVYYVPGSEVVHEKSSSYKYSPVAGEQSGYSGGDVSNRFVVIPSERSVVLQSSGAVPAGGFAEEKGVVYHTSSGNVGAANRNAAGYSVASTPFKSHYTSSYPGYSQVSGESPRYDFSSDRNLLYSYSSPNMVSPFSYAYSSGNNQVYKKA